MPQCSRAGQSNERVPRSRARMDLPHPTTRPQDRNGRWLLARCQSRLSSRCLDPPHSRARRVPPAYPQRGHTHDRRSRGGRTSFALTGANRHRDHAGPLRRTRVNANAGPTSGPTRDLLVATRRAAVMEGEPTPVLPDRARQPPHHGAHELAAGQRQQLRELGRAAWRTFLFHYYREAGSTPPPHHAAAEPCTPCASNSPPPKRPTPTPNSRSSTASKTNPTLHDRSRHVRRSGTARRRIDSIDVIEERVGPHGQESRRRLDHVRHRARKFHVRRSVRFTADGTGRCSSPNTSAAQRDLRRRSPSSRSTAGRSCTHHRQAAKWAYPRCATWARGRRAEASPDAETSTGRRPVVGRAPCRNWPGRTE
jgi:hypothetical protein